MDVYLWYEDLDTAKYELDPDSQETLLTQIYGPRITVIEKIKSIAHIGFGPLWYYPSWEDFLLYVHYRKARRMQYLEHGVTIPPGEPNYLYVTDLGKARKIETRQIVHTYNEAMKETVPRPKYGNNKEWWEYEVSV